MNLAWAQAIAQGRWFDDIEEWLIRDLQNSGIERASGRWSLSHYRKMIARTRRTMRSVRKARKAIEGLP